MTLSPRLRRTAVAAGAGIGTAGALTGVLMLGPVAAMALLALVFVLVWPLAAVIKHLADETTYRSPALVGAYAAAGVLCLPGLARLVAWGAAGIAIILVVVLVFVLLDLVLPDGRRSRRGRRGPQELSFRLTDHQLAQVGPTDEADAMDDEKLFASLRCPLSTEELCTVWTETTATLAQGAGARDRQTVAEVRRICLDEFERRNPAGFQRWIEAGAPSDPGTFLLPHPGSEN
ncbi:hypothetical protein Kfla_0898 [Kribbella flavida DSM 17836]|uniref:Uncharacterized protein n=1 Tax=Kribbella flavida (strain DSM 17836 / JCM 10339 / NBRC 14399) TaxID=479435 RepID=D2Q005_KRIFD|nr:hypothetical protein [Kribbella flavida]ADB30003.1 hypothetical protein Kfla_0898 [Kribbella flavida DSM 17836]